MHVVGIDGQPAEPFLSRESRITLSPGNRADVLIDAIMKPSSEATIFVRQDDSEVPLARIIYGDGIVPPGATMPDGYAGESVKPLEPNPLPARMDFRGALRIDLPLNDSGAGTLAAKPLFSAKRGRTVVMAIANRSASPQTVHIHGHHVRLLDNLDDGWKPYWLDTILCVPQATTRVAFVADNPGKWLLHARAVGADGGALPWFEVT
jgi:FtsP/CotA-like multicopper oxidase with cupredoxin domain